MAGTTAGGLAGSLHPLVEGTGATWVASAMSEADRPAAAAGMMSADGIHIELVEPEPEVYNLAYNVVSNAMLWFCHHHLFDSARRPRTDQRWMEAWEAYRTYNRLIAERVAKVAPEGGRVLVQDYHLALMGRSCHGSGPTSGPPTSPTPRLPTPRCSACCPPRSAASYWPPRPASAHAASTPSGGPSAFRANQALDASGAEGRPTFVSPLSTDPDRLRASAAEPDVGQALARIEE